MKRIVLLICCAASLSVSAQDTIEPTIVEDTVNIAPQKEHKGFFKKVMDYISNKDNKEIKEKGVRLSILGGPYYSGDAGFGIAANGTINYRLKGCDAGMQTSFASAYASASTAGFWKTGIFGTTFFAGDKQRINCDLAFGFSPRNFWGIGYDAAVDDNAYLNLKQYEALVDLEYVYAIRPKLFVGPAAVFNFNTTKQEVPVEMLQGQDRTVRNYGLGFAIQYDSRDLITNASRGVYLHFKTLFYPKFMWNKYAFTSVDFLTSYYHTAWKDAIIAAQFNAKFNFGNPSWAMMSLLGGNESLRGYYLGRYRDKHKLTMQVELRQHVWKRSGVVAWAGLGHIFHDSESFGKHLLPNFGVGYRFEFRKKMNLRLDYGFGLKGQSGIVFSINEAF